MPTPGPPPTTSAPAADKFLQEQYENPTQFQFGGFGNDWVGKTADVKTQQDADYAGFQDWLKGQMSPTGGVGGSGGYGSFSMGGGGGLQVDKSVTELQDLNEVARGLFDENLASAEGALKLQRDEQTDELTASLFGRGAQRSTVAQDAAGRMMFGQDAALGSLRAQYNDQIISAMQKDRDARVALEQTAVQGRAQLGAARASAAGQGAMAAAQRYATTAQTLASAFATQTGFNNNLIDNYTAAGNQELATNASILNNTVTSATNNLNNLRTTQTSAENSRRSANAQKYTADRGLDAAKLDFALGQDRLDLDRDLGYGRLNLDTFRALMGDENADADRAAGDVSAWDKYLAMMTTLGGAYLQGRG
jgi:hypothetical protein